VTQVLDRVGTSRLSDADARALAAQLAPLLVPPVVAALRTELRRRRRGTRAGLLRAVADAVHEAAFTAVEVLDAATINDVLRAALDRAHIDKPADLGRALLTFERRGTVDGLRLQRLGEEACGVVWRVFADAERERPDPSTR
jgi:hypothetical protein